VWVAHPFFNSEIYAALEKNCMKSKRACPISVPRPTDWFSSSR